MLVERASLVYNKIMQLVFLPRLTCALVAAMLFLASLPGAAQAANCYGNTYTVSPGDSLYSISLQCGIPYAALLGINVEIPDPNTIRPGQVVRLVAGVPLYNNPTGGPAQVGGLQEDGDYIVRPGDSLARIAYLYRTNVPQLAQLNPQLGSRGVVHPGQRIHLPDGTSLPKGWIGISTLIARRYEKIEVRLVDFPAYADVDVSLGEMSDDDSVIRYVTYEGQADARGGLRLEVSIPYYAWPGEEWVVEATAESDRPVRVISPVITIE